MGLQYYKVAVQTHPTTGVPHLDILLLYKGSRLMGLTRFRYLIKPGHLISYKKLNQAILDYGNKQDPSPLTNFTDHDHILKVNAIKQSPYDVMKVQMKKDPFCFNVHKWAAQSGLDSALSTTSWGKHTAFLRNQQQVYCGQLLHDKPGFKYITSDLVKEVWSEQEFQFYLKTIGMFTVYNNVISKLNQVLTYGFNRPHKSKQLLIVGVPNTGKTSLALKIRQFTSVYFMGVHNWFPSYKPEVYRMILWNQFNLRTMPYPELLNLLEGVPMDLQYKGGSVLKTDNQLIYMTSNMTLQQHICARFSSEQARQLARANLRARIDQIILPEGIDLFSLIKVIKPV